MSLVFGAATSDRVVVPTDSRLTALSQFTVYAWIYPTTLTNNRLIANKLRDASASAWHGMITGTGGNVEFLVLGPTGPTSNDAITNDAPLATLNQWYFVAYVCNWGVSNAIYVGGLTTLAAARSLGTNTLGTTQATDTGGNLLIGNRNAADRAFQGRIGAIGVHPGLLTLGQIRDLQFATRALGGGPLYDLGRYDAGTQRDLSGGGADGTVTGATRGDPAPLRRWRRAGGLVVPYAVVGAQTIAVGLASATDTGLAATAKKAVATGQPSEADTALAISPAHRFAAGIASTTDTAISATPAKALAVGLATSTDAAMAMTPRKVLTVGVAGEADTAMGVGVSGATPVSVAVETNTALSVTAIKAVAVGIALTTESALVLAVQKAAAVGLASSIEAGLGITAAKSLAVGLALATDTALPTSASKLVAAGLSTEADTAFAITASGGTPAVAVAIMQHADLTIAAGRRAAMTAAADRDATLTIPGGRRATLVTAS